MCAGGCNQNSGNCSCGCETIIVPQATGPTGPTGPSGTTVLTWDTTTYTPSGTGTNVLVWSYTLPANTLPTNGDEIEIVITGAWLNVAVRYLRLDINGSAITTLAQASGGLTNGVFVNKTTITRVSNTSTEGFSITTWNSGATTQSFVGYPYTTDFTASQLVRIYVNQDVADSVRIDSIKIKKSII